MPRVLEYPQLTKEEISGEEFLLLDSENGTKSAKASEFIEAVKKNIEEEGGAYHKPATGIPEEDLSEEVREKLISKETVDGMQNYISGLLNQTEPKVPAGYVWGTTADGSAWLPMSGGGSGSDAFVTPEQFGAVGDGTADDSNAVQMALNAGASGKEIYLEKSYVITKDIFVRSNTVIKGNKKLSNLSFRGGRLCLYDGEATHDVKIDNVNFYSASGTIFYAHNTTRPYNIHFEDCYFGGKTLMDVDCETGYFHFTRCKFDRGSTTTPIILDYTGSGTNRINYWYFTECKFEGNSYYDASFRFVRLGGCTMMMFTNCDICNMSNVFDLVQHGSYKPLLLQCFNNKFWNIQGEILDIAKSSRFIFTGNVVYSTKTGVVHFGNSSTSNSILNSEMITNNYFWIINNFKKSPNGLVTGNYVISGDGSMVTAFDVVAVTQAEYNQMSAHDEGTIYYIGGDE